MKKRNMLFLTIATALCLCLGLAACSKDEAHAHTLTYTEAAAATCTEAGNTAYYYCSECGKYFSDDEAETEISSSDTIVAALGHSYDDGTTSKEATCTEKGVKTYTCTVCGGSNTKTISSLGHDYVSAENGITVDTSTGNVYTGICSRCNTQNTVDGYTYIFDNNGLYTILKEVDTTKTGSSSVTIPYNTLTVGNGETIDKTFAKPFTSVTIPNSVTSIEERAFSACNKLTNVYYNGTASQWANISFGDFYATPLCYAGSAGNLYLNGVLATDITLEGITSVNDYAFYNCTSLTSITIGSGVTSIGNCAFYCCFGLTSIMIPNSVTNIGTGAFDCCEFLASITIGSGVKSIGSYAFNATGYYNDSNNWQDGVLYIGKYLIKAKTSVSGSYNIKSGTTVIAGSAFSGCSSLTSVVIPDSVTSIGTYAFEKCAAEIIWGDHPAMKEISSYAFVSYAGTNFTIPDSVNNIGDYAFYKCTSLTNIKIPNSVNNIGYRAFYDCESLTDVYYIGTASQWASISFGDGRANPLYYADNLYLNGTLAENITLEGITSINAYAFYNYDSLISITIGNGITSIGDEAFYSCSSLVSIAIPNSVTSIGDAAFGWCESLTSVYYSGAASQWASISFESATSNPLYDTSYYYTYARKLYLNGVLPTEITLEKITNINAYAFYNCDSLTSVTIRSGVTSIGDAAFLRHSMVALRLQTLRFQTV